jgi:hypothetical protein
MVDHGVWAAPRHAAGDRALRRPIVDAARLAELTRYQVLTFIDAFGSGIDLGKAMGVIDAIPAEILRAATEFPHLNPATLKDRSRLS